MQVSCQFFSELAKSINSNEAIVLNRDGIWKKMGVGKWLINRLPFLKKSHLLETIETFIDILDQVEHVPVQFPVHDAVDFAGLRAVALALLMQSDGKSGEKLQQAIFSLKRHLVALTYRWEISGEISEKSNSKCLEKLINDASNWKKYRLNLPTDELTERDLQLLRMAAQYAQFIELIEENYQLKEDFFIWVIQDHNHPGAFIEYPYVAKTLNKCNLQQRVGRIPGVGLEIEYCTAQGRIEKILTLPFEGTRISILNLDHEVKLKGNYRLKIADIFDQFANKEWNVGNVEYLANGITNWNIHYLGYWDADEKKYQSIDIKKQCWWKELPTFEILSVKEVEARYGVHIQGRPWIISAAATRQNPNLDLENTHAYLHIAQPEEAGSYRILNFGKFGFKYPVGFLDKILTACITQTATIAFPDENVFYSNRQTAFQPFMMTEYQAYNVMESIRNDIIRSRNGNLTYQIHSDNCAMWTNEKLAAQLGEEGVPDMYSLPMWETEPKGALGVLFKFIRTLPEDFKVKMLTVCHFPFNSWQGVWVENEDQKIWKSMINAPFWKTGQVFLPALLHHKKALGILNTVHHCSLLSRVGWRRIKHNSIQFYFVRKNINNNLPLSAWQKKYREIWSWIFYEIKNLQAPWLSYSITFPHVAARNLIECRIYTSY